VTLPSELEEAVVLYDRLVDGTFSTSDIESSQVLEAIDKRIQTVKSSMIDQRTAQFWIKYMEMIDIVRLFLRSERTGDRLLNLQTLYRMLPYMAVSGHNLYTKSLHIYLQLMEKLPYEHSEVYKRFIQDLHVVRRSNRFWAGLSTDLVIEQVLLRSLKTSGGLTRGRSMTETQRLVVKEGNQGRKVSFTGLMAICVKEEFLTNKENKQTLIDILAERLEQCGNQVMSASGDAGLPIPKTAFEATSKSDTVLVGDATDLLVLLRCYHKMSSSYNLYFMPEPKKGSLLPRKYLNIGIVIENLCESVCEHLYAHVILGCDTTSRLFRIRKSCWTNSFEGQ